ncbi:hypothetical protein NESM_000629400 [Novymonas esmeraldas]|uniref:Nuclear pore complex protein Nup85 n=1 Tax=Novymonas esmeraldas TaxID=1808958 RepID=A0AAW0ETN6_9TRYP
MTDLSGGDAVLPDVLVRAARAASKSFLHVQASRYAMPAAAVPDVAVVALAMKTKVPVLKEQLDHTRHVLPSTYAELYRATVDELPDAAMKKLWGLASAVLRVVEQGMVDRVNASAAIVEWHNEFNEELIDVEEVALRLQREDPRSAPEDVVEALGSDVLGRIESAFLCGHFHIAASLMDALLHFVRRAGSSLLTAEVETALANVKRLLLIGYHDPASHQQWVDSANDELRDSRIVLLTATRGTNNTNTNGGGGGGGGGDVVDNLVEDLCAASADILLLIKKDAQQMYERCRDSHRSAVDFLVAVCAVMEPYADLERVSSTFSEYVDRWADTEEEEEALEEHHHQWYYACVMALLNVRSLHDMVAAMQEVAAIVTETGLPATEAATQADAAEASSGGEDEDDNDGDDDDDDDAESDTVDISAVEQAETSPDSATTRRFLVASMAAHIADLCAPAVAASVSAEMHLTFARNDLITAYVTLFARHPRTWRMAALYACYSPLIHPQLLSDITLAVAPMAAVDDDVHRSLRAFFHNTWCTRSDHQQAVRAKLDLVLPEHATVARWWDAMDHYYAAAHRDVHRRIIAAQLKSGHDARALWLAVETRLTDVVESEVRRRLRSRDALESAPLYAVGAAVQNGFVALDTCPSMELGRCLCAAAALARYREAATAATAALAAIAHHGASAATTTSSSTSSPSASQRALTVTTVAACLQTIEEALKSVDACHDMVHPTTTFTLVEHGAALLLSLRGLMRDPATGETTATAHVCGGVLPLLVESYELASTHTAHRDPAIVHRSRAVAEQLARAHQTCI